MKNKLFVVIHALTDQQVRKNIALAIENGADGVFVIDQGMRATEMESLIPSWRSHTPWLGANFLGHEPSAVVSRLFAHLDAVWSDTSDAPDTFRRAREFVGWKGLWFGGVAFKYTQDERAEADQIHTMVRNRLEVDVVTTSGPGTGRPAPASKVAAFRAALGDRPLALASGVSISNIDTFADVDAFIVASSLETSFGWLDPVRVRELARRIHARGSR